MGRNIKLLALPEGERCEALEALESDALAGRVDDFANLLRSTFRQRPGGALGALLAEKIGGWGLEDMVPELITRLVESQEAEERFWCIYALGNIGALEAVDALRAVREDRREVQGWWSVGEEADYMLRQLLGDWPHPTPHADAFLDP